MVTVRVNVDLKNHLSTFMFDGATVESLLFEGGRLSYPGRKEIEYQLGNVEPYTIDLESRVIEGLPPKMTAAIRILSREAMAIPGPSSDFKLDPTLELLWMSHSSWSGPPSLDRFIAALVMVEYMVVASGQEPETFDQNLRSAAEILIKGLHAIGLPPTEEGLEELFDGAPPACVGLGLVEL